MFGLTKREQRWKAEQKAAELLVGFAQAVVEASAQARIAEAEAEAERLRKEVAELRAAAGVRECAKCGGRADVAWCCETEGCPEKVAAGVPPSPGLQITRLAVRVQDALQAEGVNLDPAALRRVAAALGVAGPDGSKR